MSKDILYTFVMGILSIFKRRKPKVEESKPKEKKPKVTRVYAHDDLDLVSMGSMFWDVVDIDKRPELIEKVHEHLKSAPEILVYVSRYTIEFSCWIKDKGQISGVARSSSFEFGVRRANTRYDFHLYTNRSDTDPRVIAFSKWWDDLMLPVVESFKKDANL